MRWPALFALSLAALSIASAAEAAPQRKPAKAATSAKPAKRAPLRFLGLRPHGPLATVRAGALVTPESGACRKWGPAGSEWKTLDRFGKVIGTSRVTALDRYDVTNCDELSLAPVTGKRGAGLFAQGSYVPLDIRAWTPDAAALKDLRSLVKRRDARIPKALSKKKDLPLSKRMLAYRVDGQAPRVIVGGRGMTVYRHEGGRWIKEFEELPCTIDQKCSEFVVWDRAMFMPVGVLDMNGDGAVEIVVHEALIDSYADVTLTPDKRGWKRIEAGIHGAFA